MVKRDIVFQPVEKGGLGLINMRQKGQALLFSSLRWVVDPRSTVKWIFLARYWIARTLAKYAIIWTFLRSNNIPNSLFWPPLYDLLLSLVSKHKTSVPYLI